MSVESDQLAGNLLIANNAIQNKHINAAAAIERSKLAQDALAEHPIPLTDLRVFDAFQTLLPGTAAADDAALVGGTHSTNTPAIKSLDGASGTITSRFRFLLALPPWYDTGQDVRIRAFAGMEVISDTTATLDFEAFLSNYQAGVNGVDLVSTGATDINSATFANKDFVVTHGSLTKGAILDVRGSIAITDGATGSGVVAVIGKLSALIDVRG